MNYEHEIKKLEMQIEKTEARIKELKAEAKVGRDLPAVWEPEIGETYYAANDFGESQYDWYHDEVDKYYLKMGNVFKTKQEAEDYARALELIETIRRERFKAQGHWCPSEGEVRYTIYWDQRENCIDIDYTSWLLSAPAFGSWQDSGVLTGVIEKYDSELGWYFVDYLPSIN